jgi:hypothetical protein
MELHNRLLSVGSIGAAVVSGSFLHPLVTGQVGVFSGHRIGTGLVAPAVVFAGLAVLLGVVAFRSEIGFSLRPSTQAGRRVAAVALASFVIVTAMLSGVGGPASPTGTVSAQGVTVNEDCSNLDLIITGATLGLAEYTRDQPERCLQRYEPDTSNLTATDQYASGLAMADSTDSFISVNDNLQQSAESQMWAEAKVEIINQLANNATEAEVLNASKDAARDYASVQINNVYADFGAKAAQVAYLDDVNSSNVRYYYSASDDYRGVTNETITFTVELPNGENGTYTGYQTHGGEWTAPFAYDGTSYSTYLAHTLPDGSTGGTYDGKRKVYVRDPSDNSWNLVLNPTTYRNEVEEYQSTLSQVESGLDSYVNTTYQEWEAGNLTTEDIADSSPMTIGSMAATERNTTGYYGYANAQLASLGLSGDTNASHVVSTTLNQTNYTDTGRAYEQTPVNVTGTLFYTGDDNQTFQTGTTYNPDNLNGVVYMSVASMTNRTSGETVPYEGGFYEVESNFTVEDATNVRTGEPVNTTTMEPVDYSTTNVSQLSEELDRLKELRDYYEQQQAAAGGGFSLNFGGTGTGIGIALAAVVVLMIATRN